MTSTNTESSWEWGGGGVLPVYNVAGGGDLSKTIKEDDCGTAVRSVKPRGRTGEAELALRGRLRSCGD